MTQALTQQGKNFDPEYLKINKNGTVPTLVIDGETYTDSTVRAPPGNRSPDQRSPQTVVSELIKRAPHPPPTSAHTSTSIIEEVHAEAHDPNATLLSAISDSDREAKIKGLPKGFLEGRQKALDQYAPNAPAEFKDFLEAKQKGNKEFLEFYTGNPDVRSRGSWYSGDSLKKFAWQG